jgi:hypothetical protein
MLSPKPVAQRAPAPPRALPPTPSRALPPTPSRTLPPRKRTRVVDLAPVQSAAPRHSEDIDELDALIARRGFALSSAWTQHLARVSAVAQDAPKWAWATGGALIMACAWLMSGSHQTPAAAPIVTGAIAPAPTESQSAPATTSLASIFPHTTFAPAPRDTRVAYERARPIRSRPETASAPEPASPRAQAPAPEPASLSTQERSIDTLLDQALRNEGSPVPSPSVPRSKGSGLQQLPSRAAVAEVFGALSSRMRFCAGHRSGVAIAHVVVRRDGGVASVRISGAPFSSNAAGSCMESVLRSAHFAAFEQPTFSVTYPFQL